MFEEYTNSPRLTLLPCTLRDASFVMAHLRPGDELEVLCQLPEDMKRHDIAYMLLMNALEAYAVRFNGQPIGIFGVTHMSVASVSVWALGTRQFWRAAPTVTRFVRDDLAPRLIDAGYRTMEARSHVDHHDAHRWMTLAGAHGVDEPYIYGRNDQFFRTFRWTAADFGYTS